MAILPSKFLSFRECSFDSIDESYSRSDSTYNRGSSKKAFSQIFDLDLVTIPLTMPGAFELTAWLIDNSSGKHGVFQVRNPFNALIPAKETNAVKVRTAISQFSKSVPINGLTPMITNAFQVGTFFTFGNHPKVYMITNSPNANSSGQSTLTFTPGLYVDVPINTDINYGEYCLFTGSLKSDINSLTASVSANLRTPITLSFKERDQ